MQKRIFSMLLVLAMIMSMIVLPAAAADANALEDACPCGCGKTLEQVNWQPWRANNEVAITSGHYYLTGNYTQKEQIVINSGNNVVIDLRGYKLTTADNFRLMLVYGYVAVLDSVGGGELTAKTTGSGYGGVVMLGTNETFGSTFELYGGTLMPADGSKGSRRGGLVTVGKSCTFRMYGGQILNGTTFSKLEDYAETIDHGGCLYGDSDSNIEILGGQILGGKADGYGGAIYSIGNTVLKNCVIRGGYAGSGGGNICQNGGTLVIENATISDGTVMCASGGGGNICLMSAAEFTITDSLLRNGYSDYHGGNLYLGNAHGLLENTKVEAGVARVRGSNIYGSTSATALTVRNCDITGDVGYIGKNLTLEGKVTIGLLNYGLRLYYGSDKAVANASGLTAGSQIYVVANHTFTDAGAKAAYFKGAIRTILSESDQGLVGTQATDGQVGGYCPHCNTQVAWQAFSTTDSLVRDCYGDADGDTDPACTLRHVESGHYYFTGSMSSFSQHYIGIYKQETKDVVFDLNGATITCSGRMAYTRADENGEMSRFTLLDSYGFGSVIGSGVNNQGGGVLYNEACIMNIYGGKVAYKLNSSRYVASGGIIFSSGQLNIHGGVLDASAYAFRDNSTADKTYSYKGGAISLSSGATKTLSMTAGRVVGGTAVLGGTLYFSSNNIVNITGGQFANGSAKKNKDAGGAGGNLYAEGTSSNKSGKLNVSGASFVGGDTEVYGGNIGATYYEEINFTDCYIADGHTDDYGGNVSALANSVFATYTDCIILSGTASRGANIYSGGTGNRAQFVNCQILYGKATTYAGNMNAGNGYLILRGGLVQGGSAGTYGGNIAASAGKATAANYLKLEADSEGRSVRVYGGVAGTNGGNIYTTGNLYLTAAQVRNGTAAKLGKDLYYAAGSTSHKSHLLNLGAGLEGELSMYCETGNLTQPIYATAIADTAAVAFRGTITLESIDLAPQAVAKDGKLYISSVVVVDGQNNATWYASNADAVAACGSDSYVKLYTDNPVVLTKDCAIDLNGHTVQVSGAYTLKGMDSVTDDGSDSQGKAILAEGTDYTADHAAPNGIRYLALSQGNEVTFHCLDMRITSVSLRPGNAGIYYNAAWYLDSTLAAAVENYGVAVSLTGMPDEGFMGNLTVAYTSQSKDTFVTGQEYQSAIIANILKQDASYNGTTGAAANDQRGQLAIYAAPYVTLKNGDRVTCYVETSDNIAYSMKDVLTQLAQLVDENPEQYRRYTPQLRSFYAKWEANGIGDWGLADTYAFGAVEEDDVIDVLMIGNSYCYYYVDELYEMAKAAGIKMRVCNLNYSGCPMNNHYTWWLSGGKKYQYFECYENGYIETKGVSLEWALAQQEWDVLSLQLGGVEMRSYTVEQALENNRTARTALYNYFKEQYPNADLYFHQTWAVEIGHVKDDGAWVMTDWNMQMEYTEKVRGMGTGICEENGVARINTGDAWELYRAACIEAGIDHNLCARLGRADANGDPHGGDGTHDGDIGGGQFLNAAVWYEILTGNDCRENSFEPTYTYGGQTYTLDAGMLTMLREAAHTAASEILPTYPEYAN